MGAREYPRTHCGSAQRRSEFLLAHQTLKERSGHQHMLIQDYETHTLPPSSLELTVMTTDPMVTSEITSEKTFIDCSGGDYISALHLREPV